MKETKILKNTTMLYIMNIAKMVFPLITLPYLTRVLTTDTYGSVSFVKAVMQYMQVFLDFGFLMSGTKDIINVRNDKEKIGFEVGNILCAKILIGVFLLFATVALIPFFEILRTNIVYTLLSFAVVFLTCFLMDFLFRGIEEMQIITIRFVLMKGLSTLLTFVFVRSDADILWIPLLDILGSLLAIVLIVFEVKKRKISIQIGGLREIVAKIKASMVYFFSDIATTAFGALNTLLIGVFCSKADIAYWGVCMQLISAVQSMYMPLSNGVYPAMIKSKRIKIVGKALAFITPIIVAGCVFTLFVAEYALQIVGGEEYVVAAPILRALTPLLFLSFFTIMIGWPVLGAINKAKQVTITTTITAAVQIAGLVILIAVGRFSLLYVALLRVATEALMLLLRFMFCVKYRREFSYE